MRSATSLTFLALALTQLACNLLMGAEPAELDEGAVVGGSSPGAGAGDAGYAGGGGHAGALGGEAGDSVIGGNGGEGGTAPTGGSGGKPPSSPCDLGEVGFQCVAAAAGAVFVDASAEPSACPAPFSVLSMNQCDACECKPPSDAGSCLTTVELFGDAACSGAPVHTLGGSTTCQAIDVLAAPGAKVGARVTAHGAGDVACSPVVAEVTTSPFDLCTVAPSGDCQNGDACVETGGTLNLCVLLPGDVDCPVGRPVRTALVSDATCDCSCGTEQECGAGAELQAGQQQSCTSVVATIPVDGTCHDTNLPTVKGVAMTGSIALASVSCVEQAPTSDSAATLCCPW